MMTPLLALLVATKLDRLVSFDVAKARKDDATISVVAENDPRLRRVAQAALARAFAKYPRLPLNRHLKAVYVVRSMSCEGTAMGGTNSPEARSIWIEVGNPSEGEPRWIEDTFHHEFAHVLADTRRHEMPELAWRAANAPGFKYTYGEGGGFTAVSTGQHVGEDLDKPLNAQGVLSEYGATEFDEDWATYAERIFDPDEGFRMALRASPRVRRKVRLMAAFYRREFPGIALPGLEFASTGLTHPPLRARVKKG